MKTTTQRMISSHRICAMVLLLARLCSSVAQDAPSLHLQRSTNAVELSWPSVMEKTNGSVAQPWFELQSSTDLRNWMPQGERMHSASSTPGELLREVLPLNPSSAFYRLLAVEPRSTAKLATNGAEVAGLNVSGVIGANRKPFTPAWVGTGPRPAGRTCHESI